MRHKMAVWTMAAALLASSVAMAGDRPSPAGTTAVAGPTDCQPCPGPCPPCCDRSERCE